MKSNLNMFAKVIYLFTTLVLLTACSPEQVDELINHSVSGSVSGLNGGTLILENNGRDQITLNQDGDFEFSTDLGITNRYQVSVLQQPVGQTCSVANASGVMTVVDIVDVVVVCSTRSHTLSGSISGLVGSIILQNNGTDNITINADGTFTFPSAVAEGSRYSVTIFYQTPGKTCLVTHGGGVMNADISDVSIVCQ